MLNGHTLDVDRFHLFSDDTRRSMSALFGERGWSDVIALRMVGNDAAEVTRLEFVGGDVGFARRVFLTALHLEALPDEVRAFFTWPDSCEALVKRLVGELEADIDVYGDGRATAHDEIGSYVDGYDQGCRDALAALVEVIA